MGSQARRRLRKFLEARAYDPARCNAYRCRTCQQHTVTVDVDQGVTASTLGCRATPGCAGISYSMCYPRPWPAGVPDTPTWEWYAPDTAAADRIRAAGGDLWEHVSRGGLLIRRRAGVTAP